MNLLFLFLGNAISWFVIFVIFDVYNLNTIIKLFNKNTKCYYYKKINKKDLPNILRNDIKSNANGESQLYNERGEIHFKWEKVITPIYLLLIIWPLFYIIPNNLVTWCFFNSIIIFLYNVIFVFLRLKINKAELIDEKKLSILY